MPPKFSGRPAHNWPPPSRHTSGPAGGRDPQTPQITVISLTPCREAGNLRAFADVRLGAHVVIRGYRIVCQPGQRAWVGEPANSREEVDPQTGGRRTRYYALIVLPDAWRKAIQEAVLSAWADYQQGGVLPQAPTIGRRGE